MSDLFASETYSFYLPEELIASDPLEVRDQSRLLVVNKKKKTFSHHHVYDLPKLLNPHTSIVANNTEVFRARLEGERVGTGGKVEFFLLKNLGEYRWQGLMRSGAKILPGFEFQVLRDGSPVLKARIVEREDTSEGAFFIAEFSEDPIPLNLGQVPLPPYIVAKRGEMRKDELSLYNTVYAKNLGSVAAPTAGRHFTPELISKLKESGITWNELTLHVGLGTFKPVTVSDLREHRMHAEMTDVSEAVSKQLLADKKAGRKILAVGTTTVRTLEGRSHFTPLQELALDPGVKEVNLFIHPGSTFEFKMVDQVLTNFHLPQSTLFMMIASFLGDVQFLHQIYQEAIRENYRFYSYGDAMLIQDS